MTIPALFRPWFWALGWFAMIWYGGEYWINQYENLIQEPTKPDISRILLQDDDMPLVLGLGDSLIGWSLPADDQLEAKLKRHLNWERYWTSAASWHYFSDLPIVAKKKRPILILVMDSVFINANTNKPTPLPHKLRLYLSAAKQAWTTGRPLRDQIAEHVPRDRNMLFCYPRTPNEETILVNTLRNKYASNEYLSDESVQFLQDLRQWAYRVIVIHLPRTQTIESQIEPAQRKWLERFSTYLQREGVEMIQLGQPLPEDHYCDGSHPNEIGRNVRVNQFIELLRKELPSTS